MTGAATPRGRRRAVRATGPGEATRAGWLPYLVVVACIAFGLAWMWAGGAHAAKGGTLALAGATFVAALARLVLPESRIGMLASRKRSIDVVTLTALGAGLLTAGLMLSMSP
jgi:Protein of unknown function (DUF3017)